MPSNEQLNWRSDGPADGPALVLIHGLCESVRAWDPIVPALSERHRVLRMDLPGFGESVSTTGTFSIEQHAEAVVRLLAHQLELRDVVLAGHSMGGSVAVAVAERERALARGLVLINAPATKQSRMLSRAERALRKATLGEAAWRLMRDRDRRAGLASAFAPGFPVPDVFVEDLARTTHAAFAGSSLALDSYLEQRPLAERVADLGVPVSVIFGLLDQRVDSAMLEPFEYLKRVSVHRLSESGHTPMWEESERTAALIAAAASA